MSKIEADGMQLLVVPFSLRSVVADAISTVRSLAESEHVEITSAVDERVPDDLVGDPLRVRQVLVNLLGNGVKFTEEGSVAVQVEAVELGAAAA